MTAAAPWVPDGLTLDDVLDAVNYNGVKRAQPTKAVIAATLRSLLWLHDRGDYAIICKHLAFTYLPDYTADEYAQLQRLVAERRDAARTAEVGA